MKIHSDTSLKPFHTFGLDVIAKEIIEVQSAADFQILWRKPPYDMQPKLIVGEGSNILFCSDFDGVVVLNRLKGITVVESKSHWHLHVAGGENWHELVMWTIDQDMAGLENLALIPGLVGAAPIQNIGAYGVEFNQRCEYVDALLLDTGERIRLSALECKFGYRDSIFKGQFKHNAVVIAVGLKLAKEWLPVVGYGALAELANNGVVSARMVFDKVCEIRRDKLPDPYIMGNAGSFFKNPLVSEVIVKKLKLKYPTMPSYSAGENMVKLAAGWLIDQTGLKGYRIGGAAVHEKQALVLVNTGNATPSDVISLAKYVVDSVYKKFGIKLEHEVRFMGNKHETSLEAVCQR